MMKNKEQIKSEIINDFISNEYQTPSVINIKEMPFAENIRMAAVGINYTLFTENRESA